MKCFTREFIARQERYRHIAAHLEAARLPFTVPFAYLERGVQVHGQWFPAVKMEWVEGQPLNRFVEESLEKPQMLRQLLDLWPKLAARLREAGIAHADLQHGNVLMVPAADEKLALKLIDYDGMYVPALAGTPSGELGHSNYQHPERLRRRAYNADVDRFSHLAIYTAVRCLKSGGQSLWRKFNNDDNLLFREADFRKPGDSIVLRSFWELGDERARAMVGRLILACDQKLEAAPWLDEVVVNGRVGALTRKEESQVAEILAVGKATAVPPATVGGVAPSVQPPLRPDFDVYFQALNFEAIDEGATTTTDETRLATAEGAMPVTGQVHRELVGYDPTRPANTEGNMPATLPLDNQFSGTGKSLWGGIVAAGPSFDGLLRRFLGEENDILRYFLWVLIPLLLVGAVCVGIWVSTPSPAPWKLRPIAPQTVEAGNELTVVVTVENGEVPQGKLRYGFNGQVRPGMTIDPQTGKLTWTSVYSTPVGGCDLTIDPQTGKLTWTPAADQVPGNYALLVSAEASDGGHDETTLRITVTAPVPLKFRSIEPQTVEAGKVLNVPVVVENAETRRGEMRYSLGPQPPPGASIDPLSGEFSWTPRPDQAAGTYDLTVSAEGPDRQRAQTTFVVTVTRSEPPIIVTPPLKPGKEDLKGQIVIDLGGRVKLEMVLILAGEFLMGDDEYRPVRKVNITKPFYLGKYEVTQEQWEAVMGSNPSRFKGPKNPVEQVSWDDCQAFLAKLDAKMGRQGGRFALPTEAQWEYACRAGSTTRYCFGDNESQLGEYAWFDGNSGGQTHPVGEKKPNTWGLYDMHGNVWEWCQDWYGGYQENSPADDPTGPADGSDRVNRGGGWSIDAGGCRSASRYFYQPGIRSYILGFRVCSLVPADK